MRPNYQYLSIANNSSSNLGVNIDSYFNGHLTNAARINRSGLLLSCRILQLSVNAVSYVLQYSMQYCRRRRIQLRTYLSFARAQSNISRCIHDVVSRLLSKHARSRMITTGYKANGAHRGRFNKTTSRRESMIKV